MEESMTLCNMVVEHGTKNGVVQTDSITYMYLEEAIYIQSFRGANATLNVVLPQRTVERWVPPSQNMIILNFDGAVFNDTQAIGIGEW
ncbi:hypothetical protein ACH5RR_032870 [Cinchona calisaya]|uniref:Uncharacterized protein n=1 Tax=Cinchona calisaya TaxID=153742 RepID=A0ABD2YKH3_9GENT